MRLEELKDKIPETPDFIHNMIQNEVEKHVNETSITAVRGTRKRKWTMMKTAAAAAACVTIVSTAVYAGIQLYHMYLEKNGKYSVSTKIQTEDSSGKINLPETLHDIEIQAEYIPEGMEWTDEYHLTYLENPYNGGFSFSSVVLDEDISGQELTDTGVVDSEERTFGSLEGVYLKYQNSIGEEGIFNQRIYLLCPEVYRVVTIYIGDDVSKEEAVKVAENLSITEKDTTFETKDAYTLSQLISTDIGMENEMQTEISDTELKVYKPGDWLEISATGFSEDGTSKDHRVSVSVDAVQTADDLALLEGAEIPKEWSDALGEDGKLKENHLSYIKSGDGINTLDEVIKTETVKQKLVCADVTYRNDSSEDIENMLYLGNILYMDHEDEKYTITSPTEQAGEGYDRIVGDGAAGAQDMGYYSVKEEFGNGGNYIPSLKAGESVTVRMAWIVNETELDHMYLNLSGDGAGYEFTETMLETGIVDIRQ